MKKENQISCHSRGSLPGISTLIKQSGGDPRLQASGMTNGAAKGFTLLEILIAVIIISVLAVIAVSAYQRAVVKGRFSSLMPTARAIRDGQEDYYMRNGTYANAIADLDIKAVNTSGMEIFPGDTTNTDLKYVFATRPNMNNNLLIYQKNSPKFADHIHCEALKDNSLAEWLCADALQGTKIEGSVSGDEYDTYVLEGELGPNDYFGKACIGSGEQTCSCGSIQGTCNAKTGEWSFSGSCPEPDPDITESCTVNGKSGSQRRHAVCKNGAYVNEWTECEMPYATSVTFAKNIAQLQEQYRQDHGGVYAKTFEELGVECPEEAGECAINNGANGTRNEKISMAYFDENGEWLFDFGYMYAVQPPGSSFPMVTRGKVYCKARSAAGRALCVQYGGTLLTGYSTSTWGYYYELK